MSTGGTIGGTMQGGRPDQPQQTQMPFMGGYGNQMSQRFGGQSQGLPSGMTGPQFGGGMGQMPNQAPLGMMGGMGQMPNQAPPGMRAFGVMGGMGQMPNQAPLAPTQPPLTGMEQMPGQMNIAPLAPTQPPLTGMEQMPGQMNIAPLAPTQQPRMETPGGLNSPLLSFDDFKQRAMDRIQRDYDSYKQNYDVFTARQAGQAGMGGMGQMPNQALLQPAVQPPGWGAPPPSYMSTPDLSQRGTRTPSYMTTTSQDVFGRGTPTRAQPIGGLASLFSRLGGFR